MHLRAAVFTIVVLGLAGRAHAADEVPDVDVVIFRLDYQSRAIKGYYELTQPFRKTLPYDWYVQHGELYVAKNDTGEGYIRTELISRITGQEILQAGTFWYDSGTGQVEEAPSPLETAIVPTVVAEAPVAIDYTPVWEGTQLEADAAWAAVRETDAIARLAARDDPYEVVIVDHFFDIGDDNDPTTAEWFVVAYTRPTAPRDLAVVEVPWPRALVTVQQPTEPEVTVHNFGDQTDAALVQLQLRNADGTVYDTTLAATLAADETRVLIFPPFTPANAAALDAEVRLLEAGAAWQDTFADNDSKALGLGTTDEPVFRRHETSSDGLRYRPDLLLVDLDGDGDSDAVTFQGSPRLLENRGEEGLVDITGTLSFPSRPGRVLAEDFSGDGVRDLVVLGYQQPLALYVREADGYQALAMPAEVLGVMELDAIDLESDGDLDLVVAGEDEERVLRNDGTGHFTDATVAVSLASHGAFAIAVGDLDGDGFDDLVLANWDAPAQVLRNDGTGHFTALTGPWTTVTHAVQAHLFDHDSDGRLDIFFAVIDATDLDPHNRLLRNVDGLHFADVDITNGWHGHAPAVCPADLNADGHVDLALGRGFSFGEAELYLGTGTTYEPYGELLIDQLGYLYPCQVGDLDGDGDPDIYYETFVYENQHNGGTGPGEHPDAGPDQGTDAGPGDGPDAGGPGASNTGGGCGCQVGGARQAAGGTMLALLLAGLCLLARRRRRS